MGQHGLFARDLAGGGRAGGGGRSGGWGGGGGLGAVCENAGVAGGGRCSGDEPSPPRNCENAGTVGGRRADQKFGRRNRIHQNEGEQIEPVLFRASRAGASVHSRFKV